MTELGHPSAACRPGSLPVAVGGAVCLPAFSRDGKEPLQSQTVEAKRRIIRVCGADGRVFDGLRLQINAVFSQRAVCCDKDLWPGSGEERQQAEEEDWTGMERGGLSFKHVCGFPLSGLPSPPLLLNF